MSAQVNRLVSIYQGKKFEVVAENITLENGVTTDIDIIRHPGASAIVPLFEDRTVLLLRQYRHAIGGYIWEIPAGVLNPREEPAACARRELIEETGFAAEAWQKLGEITPVPGYSDERIHIFLATDLVPARQELDRDEVLSVHRYGLAECVEMIGGGEIQDSKTISGIFMALCRLEKEEDKKRPDRHPAS